MYLKEKKLVDRKQAKWPLNLMPMEGQTLDEALQAAGVRLFKTSSLAKIGIV